MNTIIRNGRLLDIGRHAAEHADILVEGDTVGAVGPPGMAAPAGAAALDASGRLLMPGLVNAHTHGHNNLAKSVGDRWTLELLLNAAPWITGGRTLEDKYLSTLIGAVEMVRKGCTAAYDLSFEFPAPTSEGLQAVGQAYADAGMRAVVAPMMADRTFHRALPGLLDALPPAARHEAEAVSLEPFETSMAAWEHARSNWPFSGDSVRLALAPTIPHHCSEAFLRAASRAADEHGAGFHTHLAESKVQALAGIRLYGMTQTAWLEVLGVLGPRFTAAHAVWLDRDDMRRLADAGRRGRPQPRLQREARERPRRRPRTPRRGRAGRDRHRRLHLLRQPQHVRGDADRVHGLPGPGARLRALARDRRDPRHGHPGERRCARARRRHRSDRARTEGRHRVPRPRPT